MENEITWAIVDGDAIRQIDGTPFGVYTLTGRVIPLPRAKLLAPVEPSKVIAVGLNYLDHARELKMAVPKEPILFMKPATAAVGPGDAILYPEMSKRVDYEAELVIVIKEQAKYVPQNEAGRYIVGYTCGNDVTARDLQNRDGQWTRCKGFDTFCPLGPWIETELDPSDVKVEAVLNGEVRQSSSTTNLIFDTNFLVSFVSRVMTLLPGDVIMTGTPFGVGPMEPGDEIEVRVEGIGSLINKVVKV